MVVERGDSLVKAVDLMRQLGQLLQLIQMWRFVSVNEAIDAGIESGHRCFGFHIRDVFGDRRELVEGVMVVLFDLETRMIALIAFLISLRCACIYLIAQLEVLNSQVNVLT